MLDILPNYIHPSWSEFLTKERIAQLKNIRGKIGDHFNPKPQNTLRFLQLDLKGIKVCILGLDPYPEENRATGRSFEVGDLVNWQDSFKQASLRNIVRLIYKDYNDISDYAKIPKFSEIREYIKEGTFPIAQPNELFEKWEGQGVLLLNTYLTTEIGVNTANSHREIWKDFSHDLISFITKENKKIKWFLWGNEAQQHLPLIPEGYAFISRHPSRVSKSYDGDFLKSQCFKDTMSLINWLGN